MRHSLYLDVSDVSRAVLEYVENHYTDQFHEAEVEFIIEFVRDDDGIHNKFRGAVVEKEE